MAGNGPRQEQGDLPPGTAYIESGRDQHVVRSPVPSSDPNDPLNWTAARKALHITILSIYTLMVFASNTVSVPLYQDMSKDLNYSEDILDASYAANSAALAFGCILFVPFAMVFGRRIVYIVTSLIVFGCDVWSARTQGPGEIIAYNILLGLGGSVNESLWQMTVTDLFFVHQRGSINAIYFVMVMAGNFVAPVPSGYIAKAYGWRWSFWVTSIIVGTISLCMILFLEESKYTRNGTSTTVTSTQSQSAQESIGEKDSKTFTTQTSSSGAVELDEKIPLRSYRQRLALFSQASGFSAKSFLPLFYRPFVVLWRFPAVLLSASVYGFYIAAINILGVTQTTLYALPPYNFGTLGVATMNVPPAIGAVLGSAFGGPLVDRAIVFFASRNKGVYEPEMRFWLVAVPIASMLAGILLYGLSIAQGMPWIISAVGAGFMGFGLGGAGDMGVTYLQDSYSKIIGLVFVGAAFIANMMSTIFLFALTPWQASMGTYDLFVTLGCISLAISLLTMPLIFFGKRWRIKGAEKYERLVLAQTT